MVVGTGDLSELGLGWCTYGVGDHMSALQPQRLGLQDADPAPDPLRRRVGRRQQGDGRHPARHPGHRDLARADPRRRDGRDPVDRAASVGPYALQDFNLFYLTRLGFRPSKIAFMAWNAWHDTEKGAWPANLAGQRAARLDAGGNPHLAGAVPAPLLHQPVQALGPAQRPQDLVRRLAVAARRLARAVAAARTSGSRNEGHSRGQGEIAAAIFCGRLRRRLRARAKMRPRPPEGTA